MKSCSNQISVKQIKIHFIFEILQSSQPLPWWQLCTFLVFSQPASWGSHLECISIKRCALLKVNLWNFFLMRLSQSVVLWQGRDGIQKIALFGKRPSPYGKNSSNKQRETTVHHYFKTWRSVNVENFKNFESFFKCSCKTIERYDETGSHEGRPRNGRPRVTSAAEVH